MRSAASNVAKRAGGRFMNTPPTFSGGSGGTPFCGAIPATTSSCGYVPDAMPSGVRPHGANCGCGCRDASTNGRGFSSSSSAGSENRGVVFMGPNDVQGEGYPVPKTRARLDQLSGGVRTAKEEVRTRGLNFKVVTTNICGSDQHMVRGRTSLPGGHMVLGHEITGEVIEVGQGAEFIKKGDGVQSAV